MTRGKRDGSDLLGRLADKFTVGDECWEWQAAKSPGGYGVVWIDATTGMRQAHRILYELLVGPIPEGLHIDHLCVNPGCVRPGHAEPVTQTVNNNRVRERNQQRNSATRTKEQLNV